MIQRPGCLSGLFKLFLLDWLFNGLQRMFGFRSNSCMGCGCGLILMIIFIFLVLSVIFNTDWFKLVQVGLAYV
jgi:hypothetical protein